VRRDHSVLKTILPGVWRVAACSLATDFAAKATEARMIRLDGDTGCFPAMTRKGGNPNWGRPIPPAPAVATEFELQARQLQLTTEMYTSSPALRAWCKRNRNRVYIPEWLLAEWRIDVDPTFSDARAPTWAVNR
jgi:hypothetical protein